MSGRTDTERLEWLSQRDVNAGSIVWDRIDVDYRPEVDAGPYVLRKLIDAAMDAEERG